MCLPAERAFARQSDGTLWCCFRENNDAHICYSNDNGFNWVDQEVCGDYTSIGPSIATDSNDVVHMIWYGAGPRAGISLISVSRAIALLQGSESVRWQHVKRMAKPVLRHRIRLTTQASRDQMTEDQMIDKLLENIEADHNLAARGLA